MIELPPEVSVDLAQEVGSYWRDRIRQHTDDTYAGVKLSKLPEDLRTYEHLLWSDRPDTVIEIGTQYGASALWFRDRLRTLQRYGLIDQPRVVTLDIDQSLARREIPRADPDYESGIHILEGDVRDPAITEAVRELVGQRCFIVEDSAHEYDTTYAALSAFAELVPTGGYFIVEDGSVDIEALRVMDDWPRGVLPALRDWLATPPGREFCVRRDLELYGITSHPYGFLQRRTDGLVIPDADAGSAVSELELAHPGVGTILERRLVAQNHSLRNQIAEFDERLEEVHRLQELLVDAERRLAVVPELELRVSELEAERIERQRVLSDVMNSPSWRLTRPLRTAKRSLRRIRGLVGRRAVDAERN